MGHVVDRAEGCEPEAAIRFYRAADAQGSQRYLKAHAVGVDASGEKRMIGGLAEYDGTEAEFASKRVYLRLSMLDAMQAESQLRGGISWLAANADA